MKITRKTKEYIYYYFVCEACNEEGKLKFPIRFNGLQFACPECGAVYIQYKNLEGVYDLMCVIKPIFEEDQPAVAP